MQLIDPPHQLQIRFCYRARLVVHTRAVQCQQLALALYRQPLFPLNHRLPLGSGKRPSTRSKKIPLHCELADLLVQLTALFLALRRISTGIATENLRCAAQPLVFPGRDLIGVHIVLDSQLGERLLALQGFKGHTGLEGRGVVASGSSHRNCSFHYRNLQQSLHLSPCPIFPSQLFLHHGRFRKECLNAHWFELIEDAKQKIDAWRWDYNEH
jgi:hypothetical protein